MEIHSIFKVCPSYSTTSPGALAFGGYANIWPLFGASNQLLGGMTMITLVFIWQKYS